MSGARLHWTRGRTETDPASGPGSVKTLEWIGFDDAGEMIARVFRIRGPVIQNWRRYSAIAWDDEARVVEMLPPPPDGAGWLALVGGKVVGRAPWPLQAVRTAEAAIDISQ